MSEAGKAYVKCFFCQKVGDYKNIKFAQHLSSTMEDGQKIRIKVMVDLQDEKGLFRGQQRFCPDCVERIVIEGVSA